MRQPPIIRSGFTLIELMISIALGCVILAVATAGFRVSSQCMSAANRLSVQNSMLRTAIVAANQEMDFWDSFDSRSDSTRQPLRSTGCPFAPMSFTSPDTLLSLDQNDPRQWWNGQLWSSNDKRLGDYSLFGRQGLSDPAVPPERSWRHNIVPAINTTLGYYALVDYLPANFVYAFYASDGTIPAEFGTAGTPGLNRFQSNYNVAAGGRPLMKCQLGSGVILTNTTNVPGAPQTHPVSHHATYGSPPFDGATYLDGWQAFPRADFRTSLPTSWPTVSMQVKAEYYAMDFRHEVLINQVDPLTGQITSLLLQGLTTTLRGARLQRGLDTMPPDPH